MLKKLLIFWVFLFIYPFIGITQDIQYYISVADTTHNTTLKLEALDSVLSKSFRKNNNTFIAFSIQYIELAKGIDSINLAAKKAMNLQNILSVAKNNPRKAIKIIDGVLAHKYKIKDSFLLGGLYLKRGSANYKLDLKKAINDYSKAIEFFTKNDSIYVADAYLFRGQAYSNLGKFVPAGEDYKNAYAYFENLKDYEYMLYSQQGNITMYSMNGFFEKAKLERDVLIDKLIELDLEKYIPIEFYNQALDYKKMGKKELQLNSLLDAEKYLGIANSDSHNIINYVIVHSLLAEYYSEEYEFEKASEHIKLVEKVQEKFEGDYLADSNYFGAKAVFFRTSKDYKTALKYAQKKLESARSLNYEEEIMESHLLLSSIYVKMGDFKNSLKNKNAYSAIKDSIFNRSTANSLAYYQTLYEIEKKEKELVEKNTNIRLLEKDNQYFKKFNIFISIALLLLFGVFLLYRNQRSLKTKKNLQEKFSQDLLLSQENERRRISKDLHDGLGQRLLIIKNKLTDSGDVSTKKMIDNVIDEVRTISKDLHPFQLQEMGITKAIKHTVTQIDENTSLFISSEIQNIDNLFTDEQEVNIYRIVQESLSNIIKHANAKASKISVKRMSNNIIITIKDNGIGFDFSKKYLDVKSLGLKTLLERTKFLSGHMKVKSKIGSGTLIVFLFPTI